MSIEFLFLLLGIIVAFGLALIILARSWRGIVNQIFSLFIFSVVIWMGSNYLANNPNGDPLLWTRITFVASSLIAFFLLIFSLTFPEGTKVSIKKTLLLLLPTLLVIGLLFTKFIVADITYISTGTGVAQGSLYFLYPIFFVAYIASSLVILIRKYIHAQGLPKTQIAYMFIGLIISLVTATFTNLLAPFLLKIDTLNIYGPYATFILIGFTAYAIVKHHLMDVRVIVTEVAVVIVGIATLVQAFLSQSSAESIVNWIIFILVAYGGYILIKSVIDEINRRKELQELSEQLALANAHLKELDEMKTEFVSLASHELLTPVSAIEGYLSMLLDEHMAKVEDPKAMKYLGNVYNSAKRLARLIADMLNISRIEEGRLLVEKKDVDLSLLIKQVIDEIKFKSQERKQKIVFENPDGWETYGDADKIKEVVINLIGNAIKYSKNPGTITVQIQKIPTSDVSRRWQKIESSIRARPLDDQEAINSAVDSHFRNFVGENQLLVAIKDQGIGIPPEELPRLFKKFHRVGNYTTQESQGTGLGLYISRALVELHHGRIWADSEGEGKGSTFTFTLPDISDKKALIELENQAPKAKESLKPLARPTKAAEEI